MSDLTKHRLDFLRDVLGRDLRTKGDLIDALHAIVLRQLTTNTSTTMAH